MSKNILIIGNGFDLYHKLPTSYKDFLFFTKHWNEFKEEYDKQKKTEMPQNNKRIKVRLGNRNELTLESLNDFAKHAYLYSKEHITYLDNHVKHNAWLYYFEAITMPGQNWIDFEEEIYRALSQVELYYTNFLTSIEHTIPEIIMPDLMKKVIRTFGEMAEAKKQGYRYLATRGFTSRMAVPEVLNPNKALLLDFMKDELDVLNKCLDYYLLEFVSKIDCDVLSEQIKKLGKIALLNFNYTYTFSAVYGDENLDKHHAIHGEAKKENLVLGISDESFGNSIDFIYFQKFFQRIQKKTGSFYKKWLDEYLFSEPLDVFIMGHSLNKVDKGVLQDFFCHEEEVRLITIYYHSQSGYENLIINLVDMFGRDFIIEQTGKERIVFEELKPPVQKD